MKVLHYTASLSRSGGGLFTAVSGLARAMQQQGVEVVVAGGADTDFAADQPAWGNLPLRLHPHRPGGYHPYPSLLAILAREKPDLLHLHGLWHGGSLSARLAQVTGLPTVTAPHGMLDRWILARSKLRKAIHGALFERPLCRGGRVHALTTDEADAIARYEPAAQAKTFVVPNGIESVSQHDRPRRTALFLGRLHPKKQVIELIEAWATLPDPVVPLVVAGWGDDAYTARVADAARTAGPRVRYVGPLHGAAKAEAFAEARFFLLPSLSEGLPMAALEAAAAGAIPILTPHCNLPGLFASRGALPMSGDFSNFRQVMQWALGLSPAEQCARSEAARSFAAAYAWPAIASLMIGEYRTLIAEVGHRR